MSGLSLEITLRSPTLLAAGPPASNLIDTLRFIPGNAIRGVLARRYLDQKGDASDPLFERLFVSGEVRFGPASIEGAEVVPLSARSCKYEPGFASEGGHGIGDLLLPRSGQRGCAQCGRPLDYFAGFWLPQERRAVSVATRLLTRSAIDARRGTARTGQLFSQRSLEEGQRFVALVEARDELLTPLAALVADPWTACFGTGGSRGQGWAEVRAGAARESPHDMARRRFERYLAQARRPVLAVTLLSEGIFQDDYLRETSAPPLRDLEALRIRAADWDPRPRAFTATREVFGFDGAPLRLPRPERLAVAAGSAFLFEARERGSEPTIPDGDGTGWIGEAQAEGYGRAILWSPFHLAPEGESER